MIRRLTSKSTTKSNKGFTLIETLVASMVLITSLAAISLIYKNALYSSSKATTHVELAGTVPFVLNQAKAEIQNAAQIDSQEIIGQGTALKAEYSWVAKLNRYAAPPDRFNVDTGQDESYPNKYKLWDVELTITQASVQYQYSYQELSWNEK